MPYCNTGQIAVLKYKFPEKQQDKFTTIKTPIDVIIRPTTKTGYTPGAYQADYYVDQYDSSGTTIISTTHYQPYPITTSDTTLLSPGVENPDKYYYPPFNYPIEINNFNSYSIACDYSNVGNVRKRAFFNLIGTHERLNRDKFVVRDVTWIREDKQPEVFKFELAVIGSDSKQQFIDYGASEPTFEVLCSSGKCPRNSCECDCGDVICCYNTSGYCVATFLK